MAARVYRLTDGETGTEQSVVFVFNRGVVRPRGLVVVGPVVGVLKLRLLNGVAADTLITPCISVGIRTADAPLPTIVSALSATVNANWTRNCIVSVLAHKQLLLAVL